jgi:hypothetical protein
MSATDRITEREPEQGERSSLDKDRALLELDTELAQALERISQLHATEVELREWATLQLAERDERLRTCNEERADLESRLRRAEGTIADITGSSSWRLTRPLRTLKRALRRS